MLQPYRLVAFALLGLIALQPGRAAAEAITTNIVTNRTRGVAPLSVFFDASGTTYTDAGVDPFIDLGYTWEFGDAGAGNWALSGHLKNRAIGGVASHVFDTPGNYTVTLTISDGNGVVVSRSVSITVDDPDVVFSGNNTTCFSKTSDFSGCPAGATKLQATSWDTVGAAAGSGKRVLLHRGQTWTSGSRRTLGKGGPGIIGAFGFGSRPVIDLAGSILRLDGVDDWRFMDLDVMGSTAEVDIEFECMNGPSKRVLFYRVKASRGKGGIMAPQLKCAFYGYTKIHDSISVVDSEISNIYVNNLYLYSSHLTVMGNKIHHSTDGHGLRTGWATPGVIQHNELNDCYQAGHLLKLHGPAVAGSMEINGAWQQHIIVSDNHFYHPRGNFTVEIAPQSDNPPNNDEKLRNIIVERNFFETNDSKTAAVLLFAAQDSVIRNNIANLTGAGWVFAAFDVRSQGTQRPTNVDIYNNTCFVAGLGVNYDRAPCIRLNSGASGARVMNNLHYGSPANEVVDLSTTEPGIIIQGNILASSNPFIKSSPLIPADYALNSSASAVDSAIAITANQLDFYGATRPADGTGNGSAVADVGALERNGVITDLLAPTEPPKNLPNAPSMLVPLVID